MSTPITATRELSHPPARVYAFLAALENHWQLTTGALRIAEINADGQGGRIRMGTPLGLGRTARTQLTRTDEPSRLVGVATVGRRTSARVQWSIGPSSSGCRVSLESEVLKLGRLDRWLLALGGRWWLRRAFDRTLDRLAVALDGQEARRPSAAAVPVAIPAAP